MQLYSSGTVSSSIFRIFCKIAVLISIPSLYFLGWKLGSGFSQWGARRSPYQGDKLAKVQGADSDLTAGALEKEAVNPPTKLERQFLQRKRPAIYCEALQMAK